MSDLANEESFIAKLHPKTDGSPLVRIGRDFDGGYIVTEKMVQASSCVFGYGVGGDVSFEADYVQLTSRPAYLFDHTVSQLPTGTSNSDKLVFTCEGVGPRKTGPLDTVASHLQRFGEGHENVIVKMDIEGSEYEVLENLTPAEWSKIGGLVVEFHGLSRAENRRCLAALLLKLAPFYFVAHVHGNNCGSVVKLNGVDFPTIIEVTFAKGPANSVSTSCYPVKGIDQPNGRHRPDLTLPFGGVVSRAGIEKPGGIRFYGVRGRFATTRYRL